MNGIGVFFISALLIIGLFTIPIYRIAYKEGLKDGQKPIIELKDECQKSLPRDKYCTIIAVEAK